MSRVRGSGRMAPGAGHEPGVESAGGTLSGAPGGGYWVIVVPRVLVGRSPERPSCHWIWRNASDSVKIVRLLRRDCRGADI